MFTLFGKSSILMLSYDLIMISATRSILYVTATWQIQNKTEVRLSGCH